MVLFHLAGPNNPVVNVLFARCRVGSAQRIAPLKMPKKEPAVPGKLYFTITSVNLLKVLLLQSHRTERGGY